jgi:hypothetical protein
MDASLIVSIVRKGPAAHEACQSKSPRAVASRSNPAGRFAARHLANLAWTSGPYGPLLRPALRDVIRAFQWMFAERHGWG